jgi:uncharacterized membrane protein
MLVVVLVVLLAIATPMAIMWAVGAIAGQASSGRSTSAYDPAAEALRVRFARGEITERQLEEGMRALGYEKKR